MIGCAVGAARTVAGREARLSSDQVDTSFKGRPGTGWKRNSRRYDIRNNDASLVGFLATIVVTVVVILAALFVADSSYDDHKNAEDYPALSDSAAAGGADPNVDQD